MKKLILAACLFGCVAAYGSVIYAEKWGGITARRSYDAAGRLLTEQITINADITQTLDKWTNTRYYYGDPGMPLLPGDIQSEGSVYMWWGPAANQRSAHTWIKRVGQSGISTYPIPNSVFGGDPIGISMMCGVHSTENGRNKTSGSFNCGIENRGSQTLSVTLYVHWDANEVIWDHTSAVRAEFKSGQRGFITPSPGGTYGYAIDAWRSITPK